MEAFGNISSNWTSEITDLAASLSISIYKNFPFAGIPTFSEKFNLLHDKCAENSSSP